MSQQRRPRGRSVTISNSEILRATETMLTEVAFTDFSVRELAKVLGVVPGTIYARFGTKDDLLAHVYVQRIEAVTARIDELAGDPDLTLAEIVSAMWPHLGDLQRGFGMHFDEHVDDNVVQTETWRQMRQRFRRMSRRLYELVQDAARREGVVLPGGTLRERLLWTMLASINRTLTASTLGHRNESYERLVASTLVAALSAGQHEGAGGSA